MKNLTKLCLFSFIIASLAGCDSPKSSNAPSIAFDEVKAVDVYTPDLEHDYAPIRDGSISCGFSSYYGEQEAYYSLDGVLERLYLHLEMTTPFGRDIEGDIFTYGGSKGYEITFKVDVGSNTIAFQDYATLLSLNTSFRGDFALASNINRLTLQEGSAGYRSGGETLFDLDEYGIDIVFHEGEVYLPGAIANYIFLDSFGLSMVYNGKALYCPKDHAYIYSGGLTAFGEAYYDSPFKGLARKGDNLARLHGDEAMFYLDHFYGFIDEDRYGGKPFSDYIEENYPEEYSLFYSTSKEDGEKAWDWLLDGYMDDLHSCPESNMGSLYDGYEFVPGYEDAPRYSGYLERSGDLSDLRHDMLGIESASEGAKLEDMLDIEGDMAVIRFDIFNRDDTVVTNSPASYYEENLFNDLYSQFAYSFLTIEGKGIKKVVIDLTLNGGGWTEAALEAFSFLRDEVTSSNYHVTSKSSLDLTFKGILPNGRASSYAEDYDFYVMTSECTFSSANYMAALAKNSGIKVIGEQSGGGACMVGFSYTPEGQAFRISSSIRLSKTSGREHADDGIAPDVELDSSYFYDLPKLSEKLDEII